MAKSCSLAILSGALLSACSLAPDYQRPQLPISAQWPDAGKVGAAPAFAGVAGTALAPKVSNWRSFFPDPQLQALIAAALEHNRDLRIAVARVDEARALAGVARSDRLPALDLGFQAASARTPGDIIATGRPLTSQRFDASLGVTAFELDFWGRVRNLDSAARANFLASDYARDAFQLSLIADVAQAWFLLLELDERLALAGESSASRESSRTLVSRRRDVGLASAIDFLQAEGALHGARAEAASLARQRAAAAQALRLLVGGSAVPPAPILDALPRLAAIQAVSEIPAGIPAEVLLTRPDVLAAEQKLIAANANIGAARAAFLPKIALTASAGSASSALSGLFSAGSDAWSFAPVLRLPLFDSGRNSDNLDVAEARKHVAVAEYEKSVQQAFRDVASLLAARTHYVTQLREQEANAQAQAERLQLVEARYAAGVANHLELLDAQRESFAAQQTLLTVRQQSLSTAASLYKALGGV